MQLVCQELAASCNVKKWNTTVTAAEIWWVMGFHFAPPAALHKSELPLASLSPPRRATPLEFLRLHNRHNTQKKKLQVQCYRPRDRFIGEPSFA